MDARQRESLIVDRYRDLVEEGRHQFQKEIAAILPHVNLNLTDGAYLTQDELNLVSSLYKPKFSVFDGVCILTLNFISLDWLFKICHLL